jgi:Zn-dependent peptidase ImmA (M78 family)
MTAMTLDDVQQIAVQILADNYIEEPPINIYELAGNYGLEIEETEFSSEFAHVSGFITQDGGVPRLMVNASDAQNRKNFTVAHELGHWILDKDMLTADPKIGVLFRIPLGKLNADPIEKRANTFAANLLVPEDMLLEKQKFTTSPKELARLFGVSEEVIGYRLKHLNDTTPKHQASSR